MLVPRVCADADRDHALCPRAGAGGALHAFWRPKAERHRDRSVRATPRAYGAFIRIKAEATLRWRQTFPSSPCAGRRKGGGRVLLVYRRALCSDHPPAALSMALMRLLALTGSPPTFRYTSSMPQRATQRGSRVRRVITMREARPGTAGSIQRRRARVSLYLLEIC